MAKELKRVVKKLFLETLDEVLKGKGIKCPIGKTSFETQCIAKAYHLKCYGGPECSNLMEEMLEQFSAEAMRIYFTDAFLLKLEEMSEKDAEGIEERLKMLYKAAILDELMESKKCSIFFSEALMMSGC